MNTTNPQSDYVAERIDMLTKELASKRRATNFSSNATLIVGMAAIVLLCAYFGYGYKMLDDLTQPEEVVAAAKMYVIDYSEEARRVAEKEIDNLAPIWAERASEELIANMPSMREQAEEMIVSYFDDQIDQSKAMTRAEFTKIMKANRDDFDDAINMIVEEGMTDDFVDKIMPIIEEQYAMDMKANVSSVLGGLQDINRRIDKLADGDNLNPLEEQQRHILGLTRLLRE